MDSYFTSWALARSLYENQTYICGSVKSNMAAGLPPVIIDKKSDLSTRLNRGGYVMLHNSTAFVVFLKLPSIVQIHMYCCKTVKSG